jgi:hypothetical protein
MSQWMASEPPGKSAWRAARIIQAVTNFINHNVVVYLEGLTA